MTTNTTVASKLEAVTQNEQRLLAAIQSNRAQAKQLDEQYKNMEEQRHVFAGAKLVLQELQNEASSDTDGNTPDMAPVEALPVQS